MFPWPPQEAARKPATQGAKDNDPSPGSAPGAEPTGKGGQVQWRGGVGGRRRQLGSPTIHAVAAFLKHPQGTKSMVWSFVSLFYPHRELNPREGM